MTQTIRIGRQTLGPGKPVFVIAEVGSNHNQKLSLAKKLIDVAATAGADAVKFQTFRGKRLYSRFTPTPKHGPFVRYFRGKTVPEAFQQWELPRAFHRPLAAYAKKRGLIFLSTPFDAEAVDFVMKLTVPAFKIASYELTNLPLVRHAAQKGKPMILSTGGADLQRIHDAVNACRSVGNQKIMLLHCIAEYPAPFAHMNLKAVETLKKIFRLPVGLSDHSEGSLAAIAAISLGAVAVEKHITLSRKLQGPDHAFAMEPEPFRRFVRDIRDATAALGSGVKRATSAERADAAGTSIVAVVTIPKGTRITPAMLTVKRPARGIAPRDWHRVIGRRARRTILQDHWLAWEDLA